MTAREIVVGAGPAGAAAACHLARAGRTPLLMERERVPEHKICGEFLSVEAQAYLADLGVDAIALGAAPITRLRLIHGTRIAETALPFQALGLSRKRLDEALIAQAVESGAELLAGTPVRSIEAGHGEVSIEASERAFRARTAFLATGKHDVRGAKRDANGTTDDLIGFKMHFRLAPDAQAELRGAIEVILFAGGYAGLQNVEAGIANLCLVVRKARFEAVGKSWDALLAHLRETCPHLAARLDGALALFDRPLSIFQVPYGFVHSHQRDAPPGLFRLGDQVGVIPSFSGDGISIALHSGALAAQMHLAGQDAARYHRRVGADIARQIRLAALLYEVGQGAVRQRAMVHAAQAWPGAMRLLASLTRVPRAALARTGVLAA